MFETEVNRGAMELDLVQPGWDERVNIVNLSLADCVRCVLGQTFGHFLKGLLQLKDGEQSPNMLTACFDYMFGVAFGSDLNQWAVDHGFTIARPNGVGDPRWDDLRAAWVRLVMDRRRERAVERAVEMMLDTV